MSTPQHYRLLNEGEIIQEGDEYISTMSEWVSCEESHGLIGHKVEAIETKFRRPISYFVDEGDKHIVESRSRSSSGESSVKIASPPPIDPPYDLDRNANGWTISKRYEDSAKKAYVFLSLQELFEWLSPIEEGRKG